MIRRGDAHHYLRLSVVDDCKTACLLDVIVIVVARRVWPEGRCRAPEGDGGRREAEGRAAPGTGGQNIEGVGK